MAKLKSTFSVILCCFLLISVFLFISDQTTLRRILSSGSGGDTGQNKGGRHRSESNTAGSAGSMNSPPRKTFTAGILGSLNKPDPPGKTATAVRHTNCTIDDKCRMDPRS